MLPPRPWLALLPVLLFAQVACLLPPSPFHTREPHVSPAVTEQQVRMAAESVNAFGAELYAQLRTGNGNLIVSPYSISMALNMTAAGAQGSTLDEMQKVLHVPHAKLPPAFGELAAKVTTPLRNAKHKPELSVANSLWLQKGHPWKKEFLTTGREEFRAGLFECDFSDGAGATARINRWVEKETHDRIKNLLSPDAISSDTRIVLANAIYFKARWADAFQKKNTKPEEFTLTGGQKIQAPLMYQKSEFWMLETETLQALKLPYDGKDTAMYVLLPRQADGLPALEQELSADNLERWTHGGGKVPVEEVKVWLPRFKFTVPTELASVLRKMGMSEAFESQQANFKGMTDHPDGIFLSRVIHRAFVELDEVGTEAAAATAVIGLAGAAPLPLPPRVKEFRADHPFLFVIKHEPTGAVLFLGRVLDPTR